MTFDYKKEHKALYLPKTEPTIVTVPNIHYVAVRGKGDPNKGNGEYQQSISLLYAIAYTIKMSKKGERVPQGYFDYVVPPLEGLWRQAGGDTIDYAHKDGFEFISMIRLPEFVDKAEFDWAVREAERKKKIDCSKAEFFSYDEGLCVQCMHIGSYDDEPKTVSAMHDFVRQNGYRLDFGNGRFHHEIYLSDPRKCAAEKLKTVVRHPIRKVDK